MRRKQGLLVEFTAALALFFLTAPLAKAQPQNLLWSAHQDGWSAIQIHDGCYLIFYQHSWVKGCGGYDAPDLSVSVPETQCGPDGLAEGPATVEFVWAKDGPHVMIQISGTAHEGLFQGQVKTTVGDDEGGGGFHLRDMGDARNPMPEFYRDGCEFYDDDHGGFSEAADENCHAPGGQAMIEQLRQAGLIGGGANGSASAPTSAPAQAAASDANGDVFGKCVTLQAEEKRGIQDYWSLNNACSAPITVRYCFAANYETAGNEALCDQSQYRTNDIAANGKLDFTWGLIDEGTPMSNGVVAGPNALRVFGYACTGGRTPQVEFRGGRLAFGGCS